jgi:hypothetical protein
MEEGLVHRDDYSFFLFPHACPLEQRGRLSAARRVRTLRYCVSRIYTLYPVRHELMCTGTQLDTMLRVRWTRAHTPK